MIELKTEAGCINELCTANRKASKMRMQKARGARRP
jgi:hypothetical protein